MDAADAGAATATSAVLADAHTYLMSAPASSSASGSGRLTLARGLALSRALLAREAPHPTRPPLTSEERECLLLAVTTHAQELPPCAAALGLLAHACLGEPNVRTTLLTLPTPPLPSCSWNPDPDSDPDPRPLTVTASCFLDHVLKGRAARARRLFPKTDVMLLRLLCPMNASSAPWSSPPSLQRSIAWKSDDNPIYFVRPRRHHISPTFRPTSELYISPNPSQAQPEP